MFNFFRKKSNPELEPVTLTFYTTRYGLPEIASNRSMTKALPDWWKKTPAYFDKNDHPGYKDKIVSKRDLKTVKHCYAMQKTIEKGIVVPLWCEQEVFISSDGTIAGKAPSQKAGGSHPVVQYPGAISNDWLNYKFESPWLVYTDKPVSFYMTDAFYHNKNKEWLAMPGVIEFHYQHHLHINTIFKKPNGQKGFEYQFSPNDIMAYLIPMFENPVIIKTEIISEEEYKALEFGSSIWFNPASAAKKENIGGCPFHRKK